MTEHTHDHDHDHDHDHATEFSTWSYSPAVPLSAKRLRKAIDALPSTVFRVKGIVQVTRERVRQAVLHFVGRRAELQLGEPWGAAQPHSRLVFIGAPGGLDPEHLTASLRACETPHAEEGSPVMRWLRGLLD